jgi:DNA-binding SARP family transcriptional activator
MDEEDDQMKAPALRIRLFGALELRYGETPLPALESSRAESLLAYLLLHRETAQPRQHLAFLLWPDSSERQARTNLRHVLHTLRRALPECDRFLDAQPRTLRWRTETPVWIDVAAFEEALSRAEEETDSGLAELRDAIELYTGDVLEGCYDEWLLGERERLRQRYLTTLERLVARLATRGDYAQAIPYAERLLRQDPLHEETYRLLMRLHDARGDRARALRVYHVCAATLERELGIEPSAQTREAYEALLPTQRESRSREGQTGQAGSPPLIGRAAEWRRLIAVWRTVEEDGAQCVLVTGEPGIGKTRLIEEFRTWCAHRGVVSVTARSYAAEGALAYGPLVAWLRADAFRARLQRLDRASLRELARLLPELRPKALHLDRREPLIEGDQRQRLFNATTEAILAAGGPLLLVSDDLHWWDRDSLQFLHYLLRVRPEARLLVAATARREETDRQHPLNELRAGLRTLGCLTEIDLERLSREETTVLAERVLRRSIEATDADQLYRETEGNPLFVVEALRAGWRNADTAQGWTSPKVQAVIESRLGQLSEMSQDLVGVAATIGREFTSDMLAYASEVDESLLVRSLDELWRRRIIREQGADAYDFSHDKIREVAYRAISPPQRRRYHLRVAQALERAYSQNTSQVSGQIAGHYERAGAASQAIAWYQRAAEAAIRVSANGEAIRQLERTLELIHTLPASPERDTCELEILIELSGLIGVVEGFASSRLASAQRRALELTQTLGTGAAPPLLRSLGIVNLCQDDFEAARQVGLQLRTLGERDQDDTLRVESEYLLGIAAFWSGELAAARKHFEAALGRYHSEQRHIHLLRYGQDTKVICLSRLGNTLWFLGHTESALRVSADALALAGEIRLPFSRAVALVFAGLLALDMRDTVRFREYALTLEAARPEHHARQILVAADAFSGVVAVLDGHEEVGIARLQRALEDSRGIQHSPGQHAMVAHMLLEAWAAAGNMRAGLAAADQALGMSGAVHLWEAEIHRHRAEFLAALGAPVSDVEMELKSALQIARRQGAKALMLRAAVSLLRQRLERGDAREVGEARASLAAIIRTLPEKRDTQDLREASAILAARN